MNFDPAQSAPRLITMIVDRNHTERLEDFLREKRVHLHYMFNAMGSASSEVFKSLGLSGTEKTVCLCVEPAVRAFPLTRSVADRLALTRPGNGIAFITPVTAVSAAISSQISAELEYLNERLDKWMDKGLEELREGSKVDIEYSLILSVINQGFSETLMDAAHSVGVLGGTIVYARRTSVEEKVKFFGVTLQAEKEIVAIVVPRAKKKELMEVITKKCGLNTEAHGIVIALPVEHCVGLNFDAQ